MELLEITGNKALNGIVDIHGAKNSVLPILAGCVIVNGTSVIHNCPHLSDVDVTVDILRHLGADVTWQDDTLVVDSTGIDCADIPENMMCELRSSIIFLGALASRMNSACVYLPGGCEIGLRPIDLHLSGLSQLGYNVTTDGHNICCASDSTRSARIVLPFPSVGATENIILASVLINGKTTIINSAREPEIADLIAFLNSAGARITGASTPVIEIEGVDSLSSTEHTVIPDRILAATMLCAGAITGGDVTINNVCQSQLMPTLPCFDEMGCKTYFDRRSVRLVAPRRPHRVRNIETMPYPGFPTDAQAPVMSVLTRARGTSIIKETIFENRFKHIPQLNFFGADITVNDRIAIVNGVKHLHCADVACTDLRGGASLVLEALSAEGTSHIKDIYHIDRGYESIENQLTALGADVKRINYEKGISKIQ